MSLEAIICPSLLSCDLSMIASESNEILKEGADWLHIDVMDAHFVPNLTFGPPVIKKMRSHVKNGFFDCHLMIENPGRWVKEYADAGCDSITFHIEALKNEKECESIIEKIHSYGKKAGIALKPRTKISPFLLKLCEEGKLDMLLIMTVEPGFGGQKFMGDMMGKVEMVRKKCPKLNIQVDGGVNLETIEIAAKAGANVIVSGSGIYRTESRINTMKSMKIMVSKFM